jgi:hypothetical protein
MGIAGSHVTAQNRRDYVRWQRDPGRAEFFALPIMGRADPLADSPIGPDS